MKKLSDQQIVESLLRESQPAKPYCHILGMRFDAAKVYRVERFLCGFLYLAAPTTGADRRYVAFSPVRATHALPLVCFCLRLPRMEHHTRAPNNRRVEARIRAYWHAAQVLGVAMMAAR
jgi:hypothetical protein